MCMETVKVKGVLMVDDEAFGIRATPVSDIQLRMVSLVCDTSHQNGILLGTELMGEHLGKVGGYLYGVEMVVDETVGRLCPF